MGIKQFLPIVIILIVVLATIAVALPNIDSFDNTYKVTVSGTVEPQTLTIFGLALKDVRYDVEPQKLLDINPLWFWQTGEITIKCMLKSGADVDYSSGVSLGKIDKWETKGFTTEFTHVERGTYQLIVDLMESGALKDTYETQVVIS